MPTTNPADTPFTPPRGNVTLSTVQEVTPLAHHGRYALDDSQQPSPQAVRLYDPRLKHFEELAAAKAAQEEARQRAEMDGATFRPELSKGTRKLHRDSVQHIDFASRLYGDAERRVASRSASADPSLHRSVSSSHGDRERSAGEAHDALPRVARDYRVASLEHDWHVERLREKQRQEEAALFKPTVHSARHAPVHDPTFSMPAPTRADDFRAAAAAKRAQQLTTAQSNPLEDDIHRKQRDKLIERSKNRDWSSRASAKIAADTSTENRKPKPVDAKAVAARLYSDGGHRAEVMELRAREEAKMRQLELDKQREERRRKYEKLKSEHDAAVAQEQAKAVHAALAAVCVSPPTAHVSPSVRMRTPSPTHAATTSPRQAVAAESPTARLTRVASSVVEDAFKAAAIARRQDLAAAAVRERRLKADALRAQKVAEEEALRDMALRYDRKPATKPAATAIGAGSKPQQRAPSTGRVPALLTEASTDNSTADINLSAIGPCDESAATLEAPSATTKSETTIKGYAAVLARKAKIDRYRAEAEAKLHVSKAAIQRQVTKDGKLVTRVDPFMGLEANEQRRFDRRLETVEKHRHQITPSYQPVTASMLYQKMISPRKH
jgi:hypothetical protein